LACEVLARIHQVFSEEAESDDEKRKNCAFLNTVRPNLTSCCEYPAIVIWDWQYKICEDYCDENDTGDDRCCILICGMNSLGVLSSISEPSDVNWEGLVSSFLLSVGNDTAWFPVINGSIYRCYSQFSEKNNEYDCGVIPRNLYLITDCGYIENYLKCPNWNPSQIDTCTYSHEYISKCY
jgi:hypothetical protein